MTTNLMATIPGGHYRLRHVIRMEWLPVALTLTATVPVPTPKSKRHVDNDVRRMTARTI